ncbi:hypothetical protein BV22DRAFT_1126450 [Leucogyrophana mollusca]|uniref:Uncharacterized protein n=1 Tax=Leucogyrophana mollusca TaxID=85980 RepID=A0ACB8BVK1_9AGAM|nr:hypothetical protein BV22DRAFT_1126450 [Leucogyrophana mollusca]
MFGYTPVRDLLRHLLPSWFARPSSPGEAEEPSVSAPGKKKALLIGIQYGLRKLPQFLPIPVAHGDTLDMKKLLIDKYGYTEEDIVVMLDNKKNLGTKLLPTKKNIVAQIQLLVKHAAPDDRFFFYYAGHGDQVACQHHSELDGKDEVLLGCDGNKILDNKLRVLLVQPLPNRSQLMAIFDSCHSETVLDLDHHSCNRADDSQSSGDRSEDSVHGRSSFCGLYGSPRAIRHRASKSGHSKEGAGHQSLDIDWNRIERTPGPLPRLTLNTDITAPIHPWLTSPMRRVLSPNPLIKCTGRCALPAPQEKDELPRVISLSACRDSQLAYDDNETGSTMTKFLIKNLQNEPHPSLLVLLGTLRAQIDEVTVRRRQLETKVFQAPALTNTMPRRHATEVLNDAEITRLYEARDRQDGCDDLSESVSSQKPGYSSNYRLDLNDVFDP